MKEEGWRRGTERREGHACAGPICQISFHAAERGHDEARYGSADTYVRSNAAPVSTQRNPSLRAIGHRTAFGVRRSIATAGIAEKTSKYRVSPFQLTTDRVFVKRSADLRVVCERRRNDRVALRIGDIRPAFRRPLESSRFAQAPLACVQARSLIFSDSRTANDVATANLGKLCGENEERETAGPREEEEYARAASRF